MHTTVRQKMCTLYSDVLRESIRGRACTRSPACARDSTSYNLVVHVHRCCSLDAGTHTKVFCIFLGFVLCEHMLNTIRF